GAFTPCSLSLQVDISRNTMSPRRRAITDIYILTMNDAFVTSMAWKEKLAPNGTPLFVSALGLITNATPALEAPRAKRFVIIANDATIETVIVEEDASAVTTTDASHVLTLL
ncbi:hypothetical protein BC826DRAFT_918212, partial [Russula brevipes]